MTLFWHELRQNRLSLIIWSVAIAFMLGVCILIYPEMSSQMSEISTMFADMGSFSTAFGMDQIHFGEFLGFFAVECGNVLGIGGALFAALTGITALAKEEKEHTAEYLLVHPLSRSRIITEKFGAVLTQIVILNIAVIAVTAACVGFIGEDVEIKPLALMFIAYFLMQIEIACVTFGISAFLQRGGVGIGLGLAILLYFMNLLANLTEDAEFLKYITPFGYTDGADIIANEALETAYVIHGLVFTALGILIAFSHYTQKDIA